MHSKIVADYNALISDANALVNGADLSDSHSAQRIVEQSLPLALNNILQSHATAPEQTFERINIFHKLVAATLEAHPALAQHAGRVMGAVFKPETSEEFLECMGASIQPLATFPGFAAPIAETMANRWLTMRESAPCIHVAQTFNEVCRQANKPELFIATCLRRTWTEAGFSLGPGSPYFDNHLRSCNKAYRSTVKKILDLHKSKNAGAPGEYAQQYAVLMSRLT